MDNACQTIYENPVVSTIRKINEEAKKNPLASYSTIQLRAELRRRKKQNIHF